MKCHGNRLTFCLFFLCSFFLFFFFRTSRRPEKPSESELNVFNKYIASCEFMEVVILLATPTKRDKKQETVRKPCTETVSLKES